MNFSNIKQNLQNIDYAWNKLPTYLVLVPGLSLLIQKIQLANTLPLINLNTLPLINNVKQQNMAQINAKSRKFANICKWHLRGSMIQAIVSIIAMKVFAVSLFSLLAILATYEMADTLIKSIKNSIILYEFDPNGNLKTMTIRSACNIF